jgi:flagellar basal-body rod protein FlgC
MYGTLDISTSGMIAQRTRLEVISANIANKDSILDADLQVNPYRRRQVHFAPGNPGARSAEGRQLGVHIAEIQINHDAIRLRYDPASPYAYKDGPSAGYVPTPDIDAVTEQINAMEALRAYEANVIAAEGTKTMMAQALRLLA